MQTATTTPTTANDLNSLWQQFAHLEERKRTAFAIHQIDTLWYQFLSMPRQLSHLEIKHDLPCSDEYWTARSAEQWAHRRLTARQPLVTNQYSSVIRDLLSSIDKGGSMANLDPYGAINIAQFLTSSAREISGWSTMTGMLSMDRVTPIKTSLQTLSTLVKQESPNEASATLFRATWHAAMIEMQMWSPTHTGGIVLRSVDAALEQMTTFAPSCKILSQAKIAGVIQPHVDWFLHYLSSNIHPQFEAPWIFLYAWKAYMIAWQLLKGGVPGSMKTIGIQDGDIEGALAWARKNVSQRRSHWKLGKAIAACLDLLDSQD
ncbi:hypothetical protein ACN47E_004671 [Coniothyrium glycines]